MNEGSRLETGIKILGLYFLVYGVSSLIAASVLIVDRFFELDKYPTSWHIIASNAVHPVVILTAAILCLRKTQIILYILGQRETKSHDSGAA